MVPIFPLERKHVFDKCLLCDCHQVVTFDVWRLAQERSLQAIEAYRQSPTDRALAEEALQSCVGYRNLPAFLDLAPEIERHLASDPELLIAVAATYDLFGQLDDAERLLRTALAAENSHETRELLADCLLRQGQTEAAEPYLQHIIQEGIPDRVDLLCRLAQEYQAQGEHEKALMVFRQCEKVHPLAAQDPSFIQLREASENNLGTRVAIKPGELAQKTHKAATTRHAAKAFSLALAVASLIYLAIAWFQGAHRAVYLVNNLERPYDVRLNTTTRTLAPRTVTKVSTEEGDVRIEVLDPQPFDPAGDGPDSDRFSDSSLHQTDIRFKPRSHRHPAANVLSLCVEAFTFPSPPA